MNTAYLGLGSNQGDRAGYLQLALDLLSQSGVIRKVSPVFETEPFGYKDQPHFLNAACELKTSLSPIKLLNSIKSLETSVGRTATFINGPREIDIDILLYNQLMIDTPELSVPHPRLAERAFALVPLSLIAPYAMHPALNRTIRYLADHVDRRGIQISDYSVNLSEGAGHV